MRVLIESFSVGPNVVTFQPRAELPTLFLFHLVRGLVTTSEYKRHWSDLMAKTVVVPPGAVAALGAKAMMPMTELVRTLESQSRALRAARDLLLSQLISGQIDVSDLNVGVGNAAT